MHKVMIEENEKRKKDGRPLLTRPPKPCDWFDLIGGTSTGGCALRFKPNMLRLIHTSQDGGFDAWAASNGHRHSNKALRYHGEARLL